MSARVALTCSVCLTRLVASLASKFDRERQTKSTVCAYGCEASPVTRGALAGLDSLGHNCRVHAHSRITRSIHARIGASFQFIPRRHRFSRDQQPKQYYFPIKSFGRVSDLSASSESLEHAAGPHPRHGFCQNTFARIQSRSNSASCGFLKESARSSSTSQSLSHNRRSCAFGLI